MKWLPPNLSTLGMALLLALLTWALLTDVPSAAPPIIINAKFVPELQAKVGSLRYFVGESRITEEITVRVSRHVQLTCRPILDEAKFPKERDIGEIFVELTERDFNLPAEVAKQIRIWPITLRIEYARLIDQPLPIQVSIGDVADKPRGGFRVDAVRANPPQIMVRLPANRLRDLTALAIKPIRVLWRTASFTAPGEINTDLDEQREVRPLEPFYLEVDISPVQFQLEKAGVPIYLSTPPLSDYTATLIEARTVRVILEGPKEIVESIRADQLHVYAKLEWVPGSRPGNQSLKLKCDVADEGLRRSVKIHLHPEEKPEVLVRVTRN